MILEAVSKMNFVMTLPLTHRRFAAAFLSPEAMGAGGGRHYLRRLLVIATSAGILPGGRKS
jgi:hypothetical protein